MKNAISNLQKALRIPTISHMDSNETDWSKFSEFIDFLETTYPLFHQKLKRTIVNNYGLVFHWQSNHSESSDQLTNNGNSRNINQRQRDSILPVLITAHYDVVDVDPTGWDYEPFSGFDDGEKIWGRGAIDDKGSLISILEAVTELLEKEFTPPHDVYFAFGFDEEQGGKLGAQQIAKYFVEQNIYFQYVLDEGGAVADGKAMGIANPVAVIGIAEKGNNSYRFTFTGDGGHSSTPPKHTAVGKMAEFITKVENNPLPARLTSTVAEMLVAISPYRSGIQKIVLSNPQLFFPIIKKALLKNKQTAAMLMTTIAFTMTDGGSGHNVLPHTASCTANIRILQGDTTEGILDWLRSFGIDFTFEKIMGDEPTKISSLDSSGMKLLQTTISDIFPEAVITPYLMVGGTDCRFYDSVAEDTYRFLPCRLTDAELGTMHNHNEYISHDNFAKAINFYKTFIENLE